MNLARILRATTVLASVLIGFASPSHAQVSAYFSAGATCTQNNNTVSFAPGGAPVTASLCMISNSPAAAGTCGYTAVLEAAAAGENGRFTVTSISRVGSPFQDLNSDVAQLPLSIVTAPVTVADLGATVTAVGNTISPVAGAANILLATFTIAPSANATNNSYVISLNSASAAAVDADGQCGVTTIPTDAPLTATLNMSRSAAPSFTSANATTFSSTTTNSFNVTAVGIPNPTLALVGSPPNLVSFNAGTGVLSSLAGVAQGVYNLTFSATSGATTVQQAFTLTVSGKASQVITFPNPGTQTFSSTPIPVTATSSSGLPVTLVSKSLNFCTVLNGNVTMLALGPCTIEASQAGDTNFNPAAIVSQTFGITGTVPGAPTIVSATPGDLRAVINFTAPSATGGSPILQYTATCGSSSATGTTSPITVTSLTNGTPYSCTVTATNSLGTGPASASLNVTPSNAATLTLLGVKSRKTHTGFASPFEIPIDTSVALAGAVTTEPRLIGTGHQIVFQFNNPITAGGSVTVLDSSSASVGSAPVITFSGNEVVVTIGTMPDKSRVAITLSNVNGVATAFPAPIGFLAGDVNNNRAVNAGDLLGTSARSGVPVDLTNFRFDFNANGAINAGDLLGISARSGNNLNP